MKEQKKVYIIDDQYDKYYMSFIVNGLVDLFAIN